MHTLCVHVLRKDTSRIVKVCIYNHVHVHVYVSLYVRMSQVESTSKKKI